MENTNNLNIDTDSNQTKAPTSINPVVSETPICEGLVNDQPSFLALKDPNTYAIAQWQSKIAIFIDKKLHYISETERWYSDAAYLNNYFYFDVYNDGIYRIKIGEQSEPLKWLGNHGSRWNARTIRVNLQNNQLILNDKEKAIKILQFDQGSNVVNELKIIEDKGEIVDHQCGANNEVAVLRDDGKLILHQYDFNTKTSKVVAQIEVLVDHIEHERGHTLAVCPRSRFYAVHSKFYQEGNFASRIKIFEHCGDQFVFKSEVDLSQEGLHDFYALNFLGYRSTHLILTALTEADPSSVITFEFDTETGKIQEMKDLRKQIGEKFPHKLLRDGNKMISSDRFAKLITINYGYN